MQSGRQRFAQDLRIPDDDRQMGVHNVIPADFRDPRACTGSV